MDDVEAIKQLKARYFRTMDTKQWAEMRTVFQQFKEAEPKMIWRNEQGIRVRPYLAT